MRRWVCVIALLAGFSADGYAYTVRPRSPVPIERRLDDPAHDPELGARDSLTLTAAWWAKARWSRT